MDLWNNMSPNERWAANVDFLEEAIARGDDFLLSTAPDRAVEGTYYDQ
jgi:hypothetical protein